MKEVEKVTEELFVANEKRALTTPLRMERSEMLARILLKRMSLKETSERRV